MRLQDPAAAGAQRPRSANSKGSQIGRVDDNRLKVGGVCQVALEPLNGFPG
jgi:hypothetical protein